MKKYHELMALCRFWKSAYDLYTVTTDIRDSSVMNRAKSRIIALRDELQLGVFEYCSEVGQIADLEDMALNVILQKGRIIE